MRIWIICNLARGILMMGGGGNSLKVVFSGSYHFKTKIKIIALISR
jgi:hypothetical protein